jgi:ferrous iron transport protein A
VDHPHEKSRRRIRMNTSITSLATCRPGEGGAIARLTEDGPVGQRLREMGVIEGTEVKVVRVAPLGDPMEIELMGYLLSLRKSEAALVEVEVTR